MEDIKKEKETPIKPEEEKTPKPDERDKQIKSLSAQKEHFREKAQRTEEEVQRLKTELENKSSIPSDKELKEEYPDFQEMLPEEQQKLSRELATKKRLMILEAKQKMRDDYDALSSETKEKIEEKGGFNAFRDFACSFENAGQKSLTNLAKQYLYEEREEIPKKETPPTPGLERGTGGMPPTPSQEGYTIDELKQMRTKEPDRYNKLAREGKLRPKK